jgi:hypothetical protein
MKIPINYSNKLHKYYICLIQIRMSSAELWMEKINFIVNPYFSYQIQR